MGNRRIHIARILLVTATLVLGSLYGYYYGREWLAKWAFAHQTDFGIDELVLIAIPQTDLAYHNAYLASEGEFEWQGQMVDALHREVRSDTLYIYGFRDEAETELKQEAAWLYPDTAQPDQLPDASTKRAKWFSPFVLPASVTIPLITGAGQVDRSSFFAYSAPRIRLPLLAVIVPPPNLL